MLFIQDLLDDQNTEPGDLMECLVTHKDSAHMDRKCRAGIEHHQLVRNLVPERLLNLTHWPLRNLNEILDM